MLKILVAYGIPSRVVSVIGLMHKGKRAKVLSRRIETFRHIIRGVARRHSCALPFCNNDRLMHEESYQWWCREFGIYFWAEEKFGNIAEKYHGCQLCRWCSLALGGYQVSHWTPSQGRIRRSLHKNIGLFINVGKTKVLTLNLGDQVGDFQGRSREAIKNVKDFIYLDSWIDIELKRTSKLGKARLGQLFIE